MRDFHRTAQKGIQFKTYELLISVIFHLIFSYCSWLQETETTESETAGERELLCVIFYEHSNNGEAAISNVLGTAVQQPPNI